MANSENSTTLRSVSRRTVLGCSITAPFISVPRLDASIIPAADPILALWKKWQSASAQATMWGVKWGALETQLVCAVGFPRVLIPLPPATRVVWATSQEEIDEELRDVSDAEDLRKRLHSDLAAKQAKWNTAAEALGLNIADWQEEAIRRRSEEIADAIFALPARGLPGVIAKLELILRIGETRLDDEETPWGELRSAVADLRRLAVRDDAPQTEASTQSIG